MAIFRAEKQAVGQKRGNIALRQQVIATAIAAEAEQSPS